MSAEGKVLRLWDGCHGDEMDISVWLIFYQGNWTLFKSI